MSGPDTLRAALEHAHDEKMRYRRGPGVVRRENSATHDEYVRAWSRWYALRREAELNEEERDAKFGALEDCVRRRLGMSPREGQP